LFKVSEHPLIPFEILLCPLPFGLALQVAFWHHFTTKDVQADGSTGSGFHLIIRRKERRIANEIK